MIKTKLFDSPKNRIFPKGLTHAFAQKCQFFHDFFSVKIRLETRFNNVLDRKETFFDHKNNIFQVPKMAFFQRG